MDRKPPIAKLNLTGIKWSAASQLVILGFLSGLITCAISYPTGKLVNDLPPGWFREDILIAPMGAVFGAIMAVALAVSGMLQGLWKAALLPLATSIAYYCSFMVAGTVQLGLSSDWTMGYAPPVSPVSMFAGGVVGGFLVLCAISILVRHKVSIRTLAWSLMGGVLGAIGWALGPSLGMTIWSGIHDLGLTPPTESFQNALSSTTSYELSLFVVWQTGMALVLAVMLWPYGVESHNGSSISVDV